MRSTETINKRKTWRFGGAILAGGRARRLGGVAKGLISHDEGDSIVERLLNQMIQAGVHRPVIIANDVDAYRPLGYDVITDLRAGEGPLAGIEAALHHFSGRSDATIILPCDVPSTGAKDIRALMNALIDSDALVAYARTGENSDHTLNAALSNELLRYISDALNNGERRPRKIWKQVPSVPVWFPDAALFHNLNTQEDLQRWREGCV